MTQISDYVQTYWEYLQQTNLKLPEAAAEQVNQLLEGTDWNNPQSGLDWNNLGVLALINAENSPDWGTRELYLDMAVYAFNQGEPDFVLCSAHLALIQYLIGERDRAITICRHFRELLSKSMSQSGDVQPFGLVFFPSTQKYLNGYQAESLGAILRANNSNTQTLLLLSEVMMRSHLAFYNTYALEFLRDAARLRPDSASINLRLGLSSLLNEQVEGLGYLSRSLAQKLDEPKLWQSLILAYRWVGQEEKADQLEQQAAQYATPFPLWRWLEVPRSSPFTYVLYDQGVLMAVEASILSIVTDVLLAEGDWFEVEMEFWRNQLKPGMVVIDVGANAGVYSFSAATRVGSTGRVISVEPSPTCVALLEKTCQENEFSWVDVFAGAASDHSGEIYLSMHQTSELSEVTAEASLEDVVAGKVQSVPCATLDSLFDHYHLEKVDLIKIDAEGHELQVLQGSQHLLKQFSPVILYENISAEFAGNLPVAEFLREHGYQLFRYQPFLQKLLPVTTTAEIQSSENLNLIAIAQPGSRTKES